MTCVMWQTHTHK